MQKKIIALAVAGLMSGAAFAQSNVTVYGRVDFGYLNQDTDTTTAAGAKSSSDASTTGFGTGALTTSRIGFKGTEDLGNGLKANFNLEYGLADTAKLGTDTGTDLTAANAAAAAGGSGPFVTRLATVGLSGNWGSFDLGRQVQAIEMAWAAGSAGAQNNAVGSFYGDTRLTDARADELITYTSPMFSGFQVKAQYGKGQTDTNGAPLTAFGENDQTRFGLGGTYANGPLNVAFGYSKESLETAGATAVANTDFDTSQWALSGSYNFGMVKVFGLYGTGKSEGGYANAALNIATADGEINRRRGWELGVNVPVGPVVLIGTYYRAKTDFDAAAVATDADHDGFQLAALYPLSKRTMVYGAYGSSDTDHSASVRKYERDQFAVGLRHDF